MKTLNWKVVMRAFTALAIIDAVLLTSSFMPLSHGTVLVCAVGWILNAPGMLLMWPTGLLRSIVDSQASAVASVIFIGIFSTLVWSVVFGYAWRRKSVA